MAVVSDIEIRLRADIARLQQDLDRARQQVGSAMDNIGAAVKKAAKAFAVLAAGFAVGAFASWIKSAIDATDVVSDLSQRTGVAIEEIAGLQLWFQIGGAEAGDFESSMIKLSKQIIEGEKAFKSIGVATRNADGSLRSNVQVLLDSGDAFAKMENSTAKTAKALELFGKSGAVLLPILNSGSEGLRQMNEMADKLGLTFDQKTVDAAGNFNDTLDFLGLASQGVARQVAKQLLPTLNSLVGQFLDFIVKGDGVRKTANTIAIAMKVLYTAGVAVWQAFNALGKMFGGMLALLHNGFTSFIKQIKLVIAGDFTGAWNEAVRNTKQTGQTFTDVYGGIASDAAAAFNSVSEVWNDAGGEMAAALAAASKGGKALSEEEKKAAEARLKAYNDLKNAADKRVAETAREAAGLAPLTEAQKLVADLDARIAANRKAFTPIEEAYLRGKYAEIEANQELSNQRKEYDKYMEGLIDAQQTLDKEREQQIKSATDEAEKNEELARTFGMTAAEIEKAALARLREDLAKKDSNNLTRDEIKHLETLIALKERSAKAVADREELEQTKRFWEDIEKTAHDTFVSIADGGKNAFKRLKDAAKNMFFDWLYQMTLKKWIINVQTSTSLGGTSLFDTFQQKGFSGLFDAGMNIFKGFSQGVSTSLGGAISKLGTTFGSKAVTSFGKGISGSASAGGIAGAVVAGMMANDKFYSEGWRLEGQAGDIIKSQLSSMLKGNGFAPITAIMTASMSVFEKFLGGLGVGNRFASLLSGSAVFARAFGRKAPEIKEQGLRGSVSGSGFAGENYAYILEKGGWFRSDKWSTQTAALESSQQAYFDSTIKGMMSSVKAFGSVLGVQTSAIDSYTKDIQLAFTDDEEKNQQLVADLFAGIGDELAVKLLPNIARFQQAGESAANALARVATGFQVVDNALAYLDANSRMAFKEVGVASLEARERLLALAGGVEAFAAQSQYFNENFLSRAEQVAPIQRQVNEQLAALGYAGITTGEQFKLAVQRLVQSGALATAEGAKTYAALLALGPAFQTVTEYLDELNEAAKETASRSIDALSRAVDAQKDVITSAYGSAMSQLELQIDGVNDSISRTTELSQSLKAALGTVSSPVQNYATRQAAQAQIATAIAIAKASGVLPSADDLRDALSSLGRDASDQFSTLADYQREVARTNNQLIELGGLSDDQLSVAERQLKALQDQRDLARTMHETELLRLDALVSSQQRNLDALNGIDTSVLSVAEAVKRAEDAINALRAPNPSTYLGTPVGYAPNTPGPVMSTIPVVNTPVQSGTMPSSAAMMQQQADFNERLLNMERSSNRTAKAVEQLANQFDQVSAGGQALGTVQLS